MDDGIPFVAFMGIGTYFLGQEFWRTPIFGDYNYASILIAFIWVAGLSTPYYHI